MSDENAQIPPNPVYEDNGQGEKDEALGSAIHDKQEAEKPEPQRDDQFSVKFAALSRKEKALRDKETEIEQRLQEIENRTKSIDEEYGSYKNISEQLKKDPLKVLQENGWDFDKLTRAVLENDGKPSTEMQLDYLREDMERKYGEELKNLRTELDEKEQQRENQRHEEVINDYKYEIDDFVNEKPSDYELIKANEATNLVYDVVEQHFNDTGRILEMKDACDHVENYLLEEAKKHIGLSKIKQLLGQTSEESKEVEERQPSVTLSNAEAAQASSEGSRFMSDEESKSHAARLIKWDS